jgi:hypothetical protein
MAMPRESFYFGTTCSAIILPMATVTAIYCSLGMQYKPMLSLPSILPVIESGHHKKSHLLEWNTINDLHSLLAIVVYGLQIP